MRRPSYSQDFPYLYFKICAVNALSLPPLPGTTQSYPLGFLYLSKSLTIPLLF